MTSRKTLIAAFFLCLLVLVFWVVLRGCPAETHRSTVQSGLVSHTGATRAAAIADEYIANPETKKFHNPWCSYLPDQEHQVIFDTREEAVAAGYDPCGHCHP